MNHYQNNKKNIILCTYHSVHTLKAKRYMLSFSFMLTKTIILIQLIFNLHHNHTLVEYCNLCETFFNTKNTR